MILLNRLSLAVKILLAVLFAVTVFAMFASLFSEEYDFINYLPQNLFGYFFIYTLITAFTSSAGFRVFFVFYLLLLIALYMPMIFMSFIRKKTVKYVVCILFSVLCAADILMIVRIMQNPVVPLLSDIAAILCALFLLGADIYRTRMEIREK